MKFGHFCLPTYFPEVDGTVGEFTRRFVDFLAESESAGFDSLWANEHHFDSYGGIVPSPPMLLSALAQRTKHAKLGTSIIVLPLHNPIEIAEQMAMLDLMSDGRAELGVGRGFVAFDYDRFGIDRDSGQDRLKDGLAVVRKAWSGERFSHHGPFFRYDDIEVWPRPQQRPHPPIWLSCSGTPASFEWAGTQGHRIMTVAYRGVAPLIKLNQLYRDSWKAAGHKAGEHEISVHYQVVLAENRDEAKAIGTEALSRYMNATTHTIDRLRLDSEREEAAKRDKIADELRDLDKIIDECRVIIGTPADAIKTLERAHELMGFTQIDCTFYFGGMSFAHAQRSHRLFAGEVMPKLRGIKP